jgi:integrase
VSLHLSLLPSGVPGRAGRDRLELLTALIAAPGFDPLYRSDLISIPPDHPVYGWGCQVPGCECVGLGPGLCTAHEREWKALGRDKVRRADFTATATPIKKWSSGLGTGSCRICPERAASDKGMRLCMRHRSRWRTHRIAEPGASLEQWAAAQAPEPGYGACRVTACLFLAESPAGLCPGHQIHYRSAGKPGNVRLPSRWAEAFEMKGLPVPVLADDEVAFRRWCSDAAPIFQDGTVNLMGLQPLVKAEIQWGMHAHAQQRNAPRWGPGSLQGLAIRCQARKAASLADLAGSGREPDGLGKGYARMIVLGITESLQCIYHSPEETREAGFIETDHFGRRFGESRSHYDLTVVSQRWLRDLLWDHLAGMLRSPKCPRTRGSFDQFRQGAAELGAFLEADAPGGGHDPSLLREEHAQRFVADQRHRERHGLPSRATCRSDGRPSTVSQSARRRTFNRLRTLAYWAMGTGAADAIGLGRAFITALPPGGKELKRPRGPFTDEVARALADEGNLRRLAEDYDPRDRGLRDIWEAIVFTGRRCGEVVQLRLDCTGRYHGLPMLWHDQTKVGSLNAAVRIPESLYRRLGERRATSIARFENRHGRPPTAAERSAMALFPTHIRNPHMDKPISYSFFGGQFRAWVDSLDLGRHVAHQARHTMATNLLRAGATLAHVRRFLGHVSDRMAEHYIAVAHSDLEDVLSTVWVAGPGSPVPGRLLSGSGLAPLTREKAIALSVDLSRRSTPADGGFCTYQPVVNGSACPWNLDCENCDKFVMSGADLLYWRRKQEQWRAIAERAPDDATADYLHQVFEPTARAIDGLEKALAGLGLLDQALALDLRRPQDYFHRIWSTAFRASDLADAGDSGSDPVPAVLAGEPA